MRVPLLIIAIATATLALAPRRQTPTVQGRGGPPATTPQQGSKPTALPFKLDDSLNGRSQAVSRFVREHNADYYPSDTLHYWNYADVKCRLNVRALRRSHNIPKQSDGTNGYVVALITAANNCRWSYFQLDSGRTAAWFVRFDERRARTTGRGPVVAVGETAFIVLARSENESDRSMRGRWQMGYCRHNYNDFNKDSIAILTMATKCERPQYAAIGQDDSSEPQPPLPEQRVFLAAGEGIAGWFACGGDCCYGRASF